MKSEPHFNLESWNQIASAFRRLIAKENEDVSAPLGFSTRVVARWQELRRNELFQAWERMSIRTAIGCSVCAIVFGLFSFTKNQIELRQELLTVPPIESEQSAAGSDIGS